MPVTCPNCGRPLDGAFCSNCGQKDQPIRQSTLEFLRQAFHELFGVDGRLWTTARLLLRRPGRITSEYLAGRRARYMKPLRLYLTATLLFFFLLSVLDPAATLESRMGANLRDSTMTAGTRIERIDRELDELQARADSARAEAAAAAHRTDSLLATLGSNSTAARQALEQAGMGVRADSAGGAQVVTDLESMSTTSVRRNRLEWQRSVLETYPPDSTIRPTDLVDASYLLFPGDSDVIDIDLGSGSAKSGPLKRLSEARTSSEQRAAVGDLVRHAIERIPLVMFVMLPLFALLLKLVYVRRDWYYSEHLVYALHNHAVAFFVFSMIAAAVAIAGDAPWVSVLNLALVVGLLGYFLVTQKVVYGQSWPKTVLKFVLVFTVYWGGIMLFGLLLLLVLTAAT